MRERHIVRYTDKQLRALVARKGSKTDWKRLRSTREREIDVSEGEAVVLSAGALLLARALLRTAKGKKLVSLRIDDDVLAWFRRQGPRYQSRMNAVLRAYMLAGSARKAVGDIVGMGRHRKAA